jgi:mevalonate pyrophosphate decarboxylase
MKDIQQAILEKDFKIFAELTMKASLFYILLGFVQELILN